MTRRSEFLNDTMYPMVEGVSAAAIIAGEPRSGVAHPVADPTTGETVAEACWGVEQHVDDAVTAGMSAWGEWKETSDRDRSAALRRVASALRERVEPFAQLVVEETGKRISEARAEIGFSAQYFDWFADTIAMNSEQHFANAQRRFIVRHEPAGVVAAVTPWNFPVSIPARKIAAALGAGCPVVLKPSELTPRSGLALIALLQQYVPRGLVNAVVGDGAAMTTRLVDNPDVTNITFTGSTRVGTLVAQRAMGSMTRVVMELGGMAPFIVTEDIDVEFAVDTLMVAKFRNNGASCVAANNVLIHASRYDEVLSGLRERVSAMRLGDPRREEVDLGPMIRQEHVDRLDRLVDDAESAGATVTRGSRPEAGWFLSPSVVELGESEAQIWEEEVFGPVCVVKPYIDVERVVEETNARRMGLAGYVISRNVESALNLAQRLRVGIVGVNNGAPNSPEVPFGGFGLSGVGREGGLGGMMEFMESQSISVSR